MVGNFRVCRVPHAKSESRALEFVFSRRKHVATQIYTRAGEFVIAGPSRKAGDVELPQVAACGF